MKFKHLSILVLLFSLLLPLAGQDREDEKENDRESVRKIREILNLEPLPEKKKTDKRKEKSFVFVPIAFYAPETGTGLGASVVWFHERERKVIDNFTFTGFGTQEKQAILMAQFDGDIFEKTHLKLLAQGKYFPESFYGIGGDTRSEDEERFLSIAIRRPDRDAVQVHFRLVFGPRLPVLLLRHPGARRGRHALDGRYRGDRTPTTFPARVSPPSGTHATTSTTRRKA